MHTLKRMSFNRFTVARSGMRAAMPVETMAEAMPTAIEEAIEAQSGAGLRSLMNATRSGTKKKFNKFISLNLN